MPRFNFTEITLRSSANITEVMNNFNKIETLGITSAEVQTQIDAVNQAIQNLNNTLSRLATSSINGLMSKEDKAKLDTVEQNANNYTLPTADSSLGGVRTISSVESPTGYTPVPIIDGVPYYKDTNTTYNEATTSTSGLMSSAMVTKLNGIATGATANTVIDNLNSDSGTAALSAKQGKALNTALSGKQKAISRGTSAPSGGSNGDIYIQYFT